MGELTLKVTIGEFHFEADGPAEAVGAQFERFTRTIAPPPPEPGPSTPQPEPAPEESPIMESAPAASKAEVEGLALERVIAVSGRAVSLRIAPKLEDAVLLILLGQKSFRRNEAVSGADVMSGIRSSGFRVIRVDSILMRHASRGLIVATGKRRNRRYRLSTDGVMRGEKIARELIARLDNQQEGAGN